jgi:FkbM family methyltransferase
MLDKARKNHQIFIARMPWIGAKMVIRPEMYFSDAYAGRPFEPGSVAFIKRSIRPGMIVLDVGANVGYFTLLFARLVGKSGRVIAFEPGLYAAELLEQNVSINGFDQVTIVRKALGDRPGTVHFLEGPEGFDGYSSLAPSIGHPAARGVTFADRTVPQITLDEFLLRTKISKVDFVKVDVEGAELFVFRGMRRLLTDNPPSRLLFEVGTELCSMFGYSAKDIINEVQSLGYSCWHLDYRGRLIAIDWQDPWLDGMVVGLRKEL